MSNELEVPDDVMKQLINVRDLLDDPEITPVAAILELEDMVAENMMPQFKEYR